MSNRFHLTIVLLCLFFLQGRAEQVISPSMAVLEEVEERMNEGDPEVAGDLLLEYHAQVPECNADMDWLRYHALSAQVFLQRGEEDKAEHHLSLGMSLVDTGEFEYQNGVSSIARLLFVRGYIESRTDDPTRSMRTLEDALELLKDQEGEQRVLLEMIHAVQAVNYVYIGRLHQSLELMQRLFVSAESREDLDASVVHLANMASVYMMMEDVDQALRNIKKSIALQERHIHVFQDRILLAYTSAVNVLLESSRLDEAAAYLGEAEKHIARTSDVTHVAYHYETISRLALFRDRPDDAIAALKTGLAKLSDAAAAPESPLVDYLDDYLSLITTYLVLVVQAPDVSSEDLMTSLAELDTLVDELNEMWMKAPTSQARQYLHGEMEQVYETYIEVLRSIQHSSVPLDRRALLSRIIEIDAFHYALWAEQYRYQQELGILNQGGHEGRTWHAELDSLTLYLELHGSSIDEALHRKINRHIFSISDSLNAWRREHGLVALPLRSEHYHALSDQLLSELDDGRGILLLVEGSYDFYRVLMTPDTVVIVITQNVEGTLRQVSDWFDELHDGANSASSAAALFTTGKVLLDSLRLQTQYWPEDILVVQRTRFETIPFAALNRSVPCMPYDHSAADYLIQDHNITYAWSLLSWLEHKSEDGAIHLDQVGYWTPDQDSLLSRDTAFEYALAFSALECDLIGQIVGGRLLDPVYDADEIRFQSDAEVLHFMGHTKRKKESNDGVFLPVNSSDGVVYYSSQDIHFSKRQPQLIFANACQTDAGQRRHGSGSFGFMRGFALAGIPNIINTTWPVEDKLGASIASSFYTQCREQLRTDKALRAAQLELLEDNDPIYSHPFYWASYLHYGPGASIAYPGAMSGESSYVVFWAVVLLMIIVSLWNHRK